MARFPKIDLSTLSSAAGRRRRRNNSPTAASSTRFIPRTEVKRQRYHPAWAGHWSTDASQFGLDFRLGYPDDVVAGGLAADRRPSRGASAGLPALWQVVDAARRAALALSFRTALLAAMFNPIFGVVLAWVSVRYRFVGRKLLDAAVDLPFALADGRGGHRVDGALRPERCLRLDRAGWGIKIAYTQWGILIALIFVGLPFVTRTVAAGDRRDRTRSRRSLGHPRRDTGTLLRRVVMPCSCGP